MRRLARSVVELTIHEGRNRQVKRMCEAVGHRVIRLHRSRYAGLDLAGLEPGQFRRLSRAEVERLREGARPAAGPSAKGTVVSDRARPTAPRAAKRGGRAYQSSAETDPRATIRSFPVRNDARRGRPSR